MWSFADRGCVSIDAIRHEGWIWASIFKEARQALIALRLPRKLDHTCPQDGERPAWILPCSVHGEALPGFEGPVGMREIMGVFQ